MSDTYGDIKASVERELEMEDEELVSPEELMGYGNQALHEAESIINNLQEDYFLTSASISLVNGTSEYALPTNIYANKIRSITYADGLGTYYPMTRLRTSDSFDKIPYITAGQLYQYMLINDPTNGFRIKIYPIPGTGSLTVWHIRNANQFTSDSTVLDIPEFRAFVEKYMICKCMAKEGHPNYSIAAASLEAEKQLMIDSLADRVPDNDNKVELDLSTYEEHN